MGGLIAACAFGLSFGAIPRVAAQQPDWSAIWEALEQARGAPEGPERARALADLRLRTPERDATPRARLLRAWVERLGGEEAALELAPTDLEGFEASEAWLAARILVPSSAMDRALALSLAGLESTELRACYELAYERFLTLADAYELEPAIALAAATHARARAPWSASNLASALRRAGRWDEAHAVLSAELERSLAPEDRAALLQERALVAAGAGWRGRERDDLGAALALGSADAAQVLGRLALAEGRTDQAQVVFRSVLRDDPPPPWALRGWGLSMLPRTRPRL